MNAPTTLEQRRWARAEREQARLAGDMTYTHFRPCKHGHKPVRRVSNDYCDACARRANRAYYLRKKAERGQLTEQNESE